MIVVHESRGRIVCPTPLVSATHPALVPTVWSIGSFVSSIFTPALSMNVYDIHHL